MKKALLIGQTKLISCPNEVFHLWFCPECSSLFNAPQSQILQDIDCMICHKKINLGDITKNE